MSDTPFVPLTESLRAEPVLEKALHLVLRRFDCILWIRVMVRMSIGVRNIWTLVTWLQSVIVIQRQSGLARYAYFPSFCQNINVISCTNLVCGPILTLKMSILEMIEKLSWSWLWRFSSAVFIRALAIDAGTDSYRRGCGACLPKFLMIESADFHRLIGSFCSGYLGS